VPGRCLLDEATGRQHLSAPGRAEGVNRVLDMLVSVSSWSRGSSLTWLFR